jgi:cation-transporting ATPase 13A3/4/5
MYFWYAIAIFLLTTVSVITSLIETKRNVHRVRTMAGESYPVVVIRNGIKTSIDCSELVHGDLLIVPNNGRIPCDLVLLSGSSIMKESMLTGESVPVIKDSIPDRVDFTYDIEKDKLYTLYQGTESLQSTPSRERPDVLAVVTRTGFHTLKGKLIRNILFPKPNRFRFAREAMLFIILLLVMVVIGFLITLKPMLDSPLVDEDVAIRCLDLITIAVPPLLPTAMAVGTVFAMRRLKAQHIFCISPPRVNVSGEVRFMVFDKTGTLTEDGMTLSGVVASVDPKQHLVHTKAMAQDNPLFLENLVTCHSLKAIGESLVGDIMDIVIFQSTEWKFAEGASEGVRAVLTSPDGTVIRLKHIFHFDSGMKRMGVVASGADFTRFHVKGAPEVIAALCNPVSVPNNLSTLLETYAQTGLRVIACATGPVPEGASKEQLEVMNISDLEHGLTFLGIVVLQNKLKEESSDAIDKLKQAEIGCAMATGDASMTGLAIARECGIIPLNDEVYIGDLNEGQPVWSKFVFANGSKDNEEGESKTQPNELTDLSANQTPSIKAYKGLDETVWLALLLKSSFSLVITGKLFVMLVERAKNGSRREQVILRGCLEHGRVYARMSPEEKTLLVEKLQTTGLLIGMCGDGANDCGALKAADIGVSLSEAEASIAAPFTSKVQNISSVVTVLREGRCALATSFMSFKYMALYSMIQFSSVCILFWWGTYLTDLGFLFEDVFMVLPLTVFMSYNSAYRTLSVTTPGDSLLSLPIMMSVIGNGLLAFGSQLLGWGLANEESWYVKCDIDDPATEEGELCHEVGIVWLVANFNYLATVILFYVARPYRTAPYTNPFFSIWFLWMIAVSACLMLDPPGWVRDLIPIVDLDRDYKGKLFGVTMAYVAAAFLYEKGVMWVVEWLYNRRKVKNRREKVVSELTLD